jgi:broad specificity phosphatase PhoE
MLNRGISGRAPGVSLNASGEAEVQRLAQRLRTRPINAMYTSPLERTRQTAAILASELGLQPIDHSALLELDFGEWTGLAFQTLESDARWRDFNVFRCGTRMPGGELMLETQTRVVSALLELRDRHGDACVAVVTHGDVIKAALMYFLGMPLDYHVRFDIAPASCSTLELGHDYARVLQLNG